MNGYKVVRRGRNGWESSAMSVGQGGVHYRVKSTTRRPKNGGPLCVFGSKREASKMARAMLGEGLKVFKCEYVPSSDRRVWRESGLEVPSYWLWPSTHTAESVTLVERVK